MNNYGGSRSAHCPTRPHGCWTLWTQKVCLKRKDERCSVIYTEGMTINCWIFMLMFTVPLNVALDIKTIRPRVCCVRTFVEFSKMPPWMALGMAPLLTDTGVDAVIVRIAGTASFELPGLSEWVIASYSVSSELSRPEFTSKLDILRCSLSLASPIYGINEFTLLCHDSRLLSAVQFQPDTVGYTWCDGRNDLLSVLWHLNQPALRPYSWYSPDDFLPLDNRNTTWHWGCAWSLDLL